jgi:hypothetical protein
LVYRPEVLFSEMEERLHLWRFPLIFQNIFNHSEGEKIAILEFFDKANALYIALIIFRNVPSTLARLGEESLPDVKMNGLF